MRYIMILVGIVAMALAAEPAMAQVDQRYESPMIAHALPIAAGALIGAASSFFIMPLIIPTLASTAPAVGPPVASPIAGAVGAVVGGLVGYTMFRETP